jgi:hypothetical protein
VNIIGAFVKIHKISIFEDKLEMANKKPEQNLIDQFVDYIRKCNDNSLKIKKLHNQKCSTKIFADIEFDSESGIHWAIEAKSNDSKNAPNTVHQFFGDLLKETGRGRNADNLRYAILIPEEGKNFYSEKFRCINKDKFIGFGQLIPIDTVFVWGKSGLEKITWEDIYEYKPN